MDEREEVKIPNIDEYKAAVRNIDLTKFAPPNKEDKQEISINFQFG